MRDVPLTVATFVVAVAVSLCGCAPTTRAAKDVASPAPPRLAVEPESRQLGVVGLGEEAVAEFVVRNDGGAPLTVSVSRRSRGSRLEGLARELSPGQSARVGFHVDTFEGDGERVQSFTLVTNDPDRPRLTVPVELEVRPFVIARPGYARYIVVQHAREGTIAQTIGSVDGAPFTILRVDSPLPSLRVAFREARPEERQPEWAGPQWRLTSTLATDAPVGALTGFVVAHTDHPRQKRVMIPVSGFVRPVLAVTPPEATVGDVPRTRATPIRLFVKSFAEEEIELTGVSTDVAAVSVAIEPVERGRTWQIRLLPVSEAPLGPFAGTIVVRTASPNVRQLVIPLSGRLVD